MVLIKTKYEGWQWQNILRALNLITNIFVISLEKFEKLKFLADCSNLNSKINFRTQKGYFIKVSGRGLK